MKFCGNCGFLDRGSLRCKVFGHGVVPEKDFCSKHTDEVLCCDFCGNPVLHYYIDNDTGKILCENCLQACGTCRLCEHATQCEFETNTSPLPKIVQKRIQQGPMTTITQVRNPERVAITCAAGCSCYDPELGCIRQITGHCGKYQGI